MIDVVPPLLRKHAVGLIVATLGLTAAGPASATPPTVTSLSPVSTVVGQYQKFEIAFQITQIYPEGSLLPYYYYDASDTPAAYPGRKSPYGADGISIDAHFTAPSGKTSVAPAFYCQDYSRSKNERGNEVMTTTSNYSWKVRFAPEEVGTYNYYITIQTKDGRTQYPGAGQAPLTFTTINSNSLGFVHPSPRDPRFMEFSNGTTFLPIASGHQWWAGDARTYDYEQSFAMFRQNGINLTRIWTQNDGYGLTIEGHFDHYSYPADYNPVDSGVDISSLPKGTQINQRGAAELDYIVAAAEASGVYLEISAHGDPYWIWDASVYDESWNPNPVPMADPIHLNYWKRNYRYRVARWGYSTSVLAWETWNEHGRILADSDTVEFYRTLYQYLNDIDPWHHLRTTSQGSQSWSPAFWGLSFLDASNYHDYLMPGRYPPGLWDDEVNFVYRAAQCLRLQAPTQGSGDMPCFFGDGSSWPTVAGNNKPIIWGELDTGSSEWNIANPSYVADHNTMWAGLFSPLGGTGIDWYWQQKSYLTHKYHDASVARAFFGDMDYIGEKFTYLATVDVAVTSGAVYTDQNQLRVLALRSASNQEAYLWVQNRDYTWGKQPNSPTPVSGNIHVPGLSAGTYKITYWDTYTGHTTEGNAVAASNGMLTVPIISLGRDVAVKVIFAGPTPPLPTPTASATDNALASMPPTASLASTLTTLPLPAGPSLGSGDTNGDGKVTADDIAFLINNWDQTATSALDQYDDGRLDAFDFVVIRQKLLAGAVPVSPTPTTAPGSRLTLAASPTATPVVGATASPAAGSTSVGSAGTEGEWSQFGHDPQHTGYTSQSVATPWKFAWEWNGADVNGKVQPGHLAVPDLVQPITGGGRVYMVAADAVYALDAKSTSPLGTVLWSMSGLGQILGNPAYDPSGYVYVPSLDGHLYKLNAATGAVVGQFAANSPIPNAVTLVGMTAYLVTQSGDLFAVDTVTMQSLWVHQSGSPGVSPASYSARYNLLVFNTQDLNVQAVDASSGARKWKVKPTLRNYQCDSSDSSMPPCQVISTSGGQFERGWPVIAEEHGIVLVRLTLDWNAMWAGPLAGGAFPSTNAGIVAHLVDNPLQQSLFALNLSDGSAAFVPAVGSATASDGGTSRMGPQPVVANMDGQEVVYIYWRNIQTCANGRLPACDGRWDATMGEMVLDGTSVPGYLPGYVRFVNFLFFPGDEIQYLTMAGRTIFHNHWLVSAGATVGNRLGAVGDTIDNPIPTANVPIVAWGADASSCAFGASRYCANRIITFGADDSFTRNYPPGFYEYYGDWCTLHGSCPNYNNSSQQTAYTVESGDLVLVKSPDGAILAFTNGNPLGATDSSAQILGAETASTPVEISVLEAPEYLGQPVRVAGTVTQVVNHLPKAIYIYIGEPGRESFLARVFAQDAEKFHVEWSSLVGREVTVSGIVGLYSPYGVSPEIILSDPVQLTIH